MTDSSKRQISIGVDHLLKAAVAAAIAFVGYVGNGWRVEAKETRGEMFALRTEIARLSEKMTAFVRELDHLHQRVEKMENGK